MEKVTSSKFLYSPLNSFKFLYIPLNSLKGLLSKSNPPHLPPLRLWPTLLKTAVSRHFKERPYLLVALALLAIFLPLALLITLKPKGTQAAWYDDSYAYRQEITFTHNADITSDRAVTFSLDTAELITDAVMQSDCDDTRFTDINGKVLRYQLTGTCNNAATTYEVVFPAIFNGSNMGYVYYGNPSASSASEDVSAVTALTPSGGDPAITTRTNEEKGPGPLNYWRFDEGYGTSTQDFSVNNKDGTISGAAWQPEDLCASGKCLWFDGSNDTVNVATSALIDVTTDYSISAWVRPNTISGTDTVFGMGNTANNTQVFRYYLGNGTLAVNMCNNADTCITMTGGSVTANTWTHITATKTGSTYKFYINGLDTTATGTGSTSGTYTFNTSTIGYNDRLTDDSFFNGFIDDLKIYNYVRTAAQVRADFAGLGAPESVAAGFSPNQKFLSDGLVGYWKADETSGNMADSSGNGTTLTDTNTVTFSAGKFANGGDFESTASEYQLAADNATLSLTGSVTISAWIKPESVTASTDFDIVGKWDGTNESYLLEQFGDEIRFSIDSSSNYATTDAANLATGTFYHVVGVYDSVAATVTIYINGIRSASTVTGTIPSSIGDDAGRFHIGAEDSTTTAANFYDGFIDDIRVYNRLITSSEVERLSNWGPGPVGYWKMDENTGSTTTNDSSGNGSAGTLEGSMTESDWVPGKFGSALDLDGSNDDISLGHPTVLDVGNSFSIMAWVYANSAPSGASVFTETFAGGSDRVQYSLGFGQNEGGGGSSQLKFGFYNGTTWALAAEASNIAVGEWIHVGGTWDGTTLRLYKNGVLSTSSAPGTTTANDTETIYIGRRHDTAGDVDFFPGKIDDVKVYSYPRASKQIVEDMNAGHPTGGSPVGTQVIYYKFDEQQGTTINNSIESQSFTETVTGTTWRVMGSSSCKINGCLEFDGSDDVVTVTNADAIDLNVGLASGFTISAWFYADTDGEGDVGQIFQKGTTTYCRTDSQSGSNLDIECSLDLATTDATLNISAPVTTAAWNHLAVTYSDDADDEITIYINGYNRGSSTDGSGAPAADANNLLIGGTTTANFDGRIDEFKVYNAELSSSEILIDMNAGSAAAMGGVLGTQNSEGFSMPAPVVEWTLNENTGTTSVNDTSGNGNTGTMNGSMTASDWVPGKYGSGLDFDGSNDYVADDPVSSSFGDLTVSGWFKGGVQDDPGRIINVRKTSPFSCGLQITLGATVCIDGSGGPTSDVCTGTGYDDNKWHHALATRSSTTYTLYVDGVQIGTSGGTAPTYDLLRIGGIDDCGAARWYAGVIDHVHLYSSVLTAPQISYDYNRGAPVGWYKFDECQGTTANNSAPVASGGDAGNDGTITIGATGGNTAAGTCSSGTSTEAWNNGTTGKRNYSLDIDGSNDYITLESEDATFSVNNYTISMWINRDTDSGALERLFDNEDAANDGWRVAISAEDVSACGYNATLSSGTTTISTGSWYHITCTSDGSTQKLYVNAIQEDSDTITGSISETTDARIGARNFTSANGHFPGKVDEVKFYNYALTADQVKREYNNGAIFFGPSTGSP